MAEFAFENLPEKVGLTIGFSMVLNSLLLIKIRNFYSQCSFWGV